MKALENVAGFRMRIYELRSPREGPTRLFLGGLHGKEGKAARPILTKLAAGGTPSNGKAIVVPALCMGKKYLSTLQEHYYETEEGVKVLFLIQKYSPSIYVELHCYRRSAFSSLTSLERVSKAGVPPMVELEGKVLVGSVSPHLLSRFRFELSLVVEIPCQGVLKTKITALQLLNIIKNSESREAVLKKLSMKYFGQVEKASRLFRGWHSEGVSNGEPSTKSNSNGPLSSG